MVRWKDSDDGKGSSSVYIIGIYNDEGEPLYDCISCNLYNELKVCLFNSKIKMLEHLGKHEEARDCILPSTYKKIIQSNWLLEKDDGSWHLSNCKCKLHLTDNYKQN